MPRCPAKALVSTSSPLECAQWLDAEIRTNPPISRALTTLKAKLVGAVKGHALLKKKADALSLRFRAILAKIVEVRSEAGLHLMRGVSRSVQNKELMGSQMKLAFWSQTTAKHAAGEIGCAPRPRVLRCGDAYLCPAPPSWRTSTRPPCAYASTLITSLVCIFRSSRR